MQFEIRAKDRRKIRVLSTIDGPSFFLGPVTVLLTHLSEALAFPLCDILLSGQGPFVSVFHAPSGSFILKKHCLQASRVYGIVAERVGQEAVKHKYRCKLLLFGNKQWRKLRLIKTGKYLVNIIYL